MKRRRFIQAAGVIPFITGDLLTDRKQSIQLSVSGSETMNNNKRDFFYKPADAWAADFIPFFENGEYHLFYLLDWRDSEKHGYGTPWYRVSTHDFVNFTEHGEMLPRGTSEEQDLYVFTGSAIKAGDKYHIFYTGHNDNLSKKGKPMQGVMHAVSNDLKTWKKLPEQTFFAPANLYEKDDWRDPFVFWNESTNEYNMLLCARFKKGIPRRRGLTVLCTSKDLTTWEVRKPFYAPDLYYAHECPDLFRIGEWWYLLFSEFTDLNRTRYRMSRSINGPWISPENDCFDGHAFYAAKTASDGNRRFIFGWNPTRNENKDSGGWQWGGNLVVHEIIQEANGELSVKLPDQVAKAFNKDLKYSFTSGSGNYKIKDNSVSIDSLGTFGIVSGGKMPATCKIATTITIGKSTRECGITLRTGDDFEKSYYIRFETPKNRLSFDMWPKQQMAHMAELDRELNLKEVSRLHVKLLIDGTVGVVYVNDKVAMNFRAYDFPEGNWGFYVLDGSAEFSNTTVSTI